MSVRGTTPGCHRDNAVILASTGLCNSGPCLREGLRAACTGQVCSNKPALTAGYCRPPFSHAMPTSDLCIQSSKACVLVVLMKAYQVWRTTCAHSTRAGCLVVQRIKSCMPSSTCQLTCLTAGVSVARASVAAQYWHKIV